MENSGDDEGRQRWPKWLPWVLGGAAVVVGVLVAVLIVGGGSDSDTAEGQTIEFQSPTDPGQDPFTEPADTIGDTQVRFDPALAGGGASSSEPSSGTGTFGGSGSEYVCDREKLIRELEARPDRMRAWAETLGIDPTPRAVEDYIRSLRPVTLTRDTQVTNHAFENGRVVAYQTILAAGTAVLVDRYGKPVVRCRCGNPLTEPVYYKKATCHGCPPHYRPPPPCQYRPYDPYDRLYGQDYGRGYGYEAPTFVVFRKNPYSDCYIFYPHPPPVLLLARGAPDTTYDYHYDRPSQPSYREPTYTEPDYTQTYTEPDYTQTYTEPDYTEPTYTEPTYTEPTDTGGCCGSTAP